MTARRENLEKVRELLVSIGASASSKNTAFALDLLEREFGPSDFLARQREQLDEREVLRAALDAIDEELGAMEGTS